MSHNHGEPVLSCLRKKTFKSRGHEVMELVNIKIKIRSRRLRNPSPGHSGLFHFGYEHGAEKTGILVAQFALGQVYQKYFLFFHYALKVHFVFALAENKTQIGIGQKLAELVYERDYGFGVKLFRPV